MFVQAMHYLKRANDLSVLLRAFFTDIGNAAHMRPVTWFEPGFILSKEDSPPTGNDKTSIVFSLKHKPGALYDSLREFASRDINLTKLESRPTRHQPWEYNFYMDFSGHREEKGISEALKALEEHAVYVRILGSYPKAR